MGASGDGLLRIRLRALGALEHVSKRHVCRGSKLGVAGELRGRERRRTYPAEKPRYLTRVAERSRILRSKDRELVLWKEKVGLMTLETHRPIPRAMTTMA